MDKYTKFLIHEWENFFLDLPPELQELALKTGNANVLVQIGNGKIDIDKALELLEAREAWELNASNPEVEDEPEHKTDKDHDKKKHEEHSEHPEEPDQLENVPEKTLPEPDENAQVNESNLGPNKAKTRFEQMVTAGSAISSPKPGNEDWGTSEEIAPQVATDLEENFPDPIQASAPDIIPNQPSYTWYSRPNTISPGKTNFSESTLPSQTINKPSPYSYPRGRSVPSFPRRNFSRNTTGAARGLAKSTARKAGKEVGKKAAGLIASNPIAAGTIIAVVIFIGFIIIMAGSIGNICKTPGLNMLPGFGWGGICEGSNSASIPPPPKGVTIVINGPESADNNMPISYTIETVYDPQQADISLDKMTLYFKPDYPFDLVSATGDYDYRRSENTITWELSAQVPTGNNTYSFTIIIQPTVTDFIGIAAAYIYVPEGDIGDLNFGADSPPSDNNCGQYRGIMNSISDKWPALGPATNYGDPLCTYTAAKFNRLIELTETKYPENIPFWKKVVMCEGSSPNSTALPDNPNDSGTFGRFQMRRSFNLPFKPWNPESNDRGDVTWQKQVSNAISKNNSDTANNNAFGYFGSAMCLCWWPEYQTKSYCKDIIRKGVNSDEGPRAPINNCPTGPGYLTCQTEVRCANNSCRP